MDAFSVIPTINAMTGRVGMQSQEFIDSLKGKFDRFQMNTNLRGNVVGLFRMSAINSLLSQSEQLFTLFNQAVNLLHDQAQQNVERLGVKFEPVRNSEPFLALVFAFVQGIKTDNEKIAQRFSDALRDRQFERFLLDSRTQNHFADSDLRDPRIFDALGRKILASDLIYRKTRWMLLTYYNEVIVAQASMNDLSLVVDYTDSGHKSQGLVFTVAGGGPNYFGVKEALFHPRSNGVVMLNV